MLSSHVTTATCTSSNLSEADRGEDKGAPAQAWATLAAAEMLGGAAATKAARVASAIIAVATCNAAVSGSQEADWGADTQAETRCCTAPRQQREQRPVFACAAWRNAIGLADGAAQLDDVREVMQHLALTCASDAPRSASDAFLRFDAEEWHSAEATEIASCLEHGSRHSCELPEGRQPLPSHFVYFQKRDGQYKARLVAGGHKQQQGVDLDEMLAPVCSFRSERMTLAVAAHEGLELRQFDMKTAFFNGYLKEEVYIRLPHGWNHLAGADRVLRLDRALHGLRQASRAWNKRLEAELTAHGLVQSDADPALWMKHGGEHVLTMFYGDDSMVAARTAAEADALADHVAGMFSIRKLGEPQDMLGIEISRDRDAGTITIRQASKAQALATAFGVEAER
jgi:hypothetical protein